MTQGTIARVHKRSCRGRSRTGCVQCKGRHKKCDEVLPTCGDCRAMRQACTWPTLDKARAPVVISEAISVYWGNLGNPLRDPDGVIQQVGAPGVDNFDAVIHWTGLHTHFRPLGFHGNLTSSWVEFVKENAQDNPALLSLILILALNARRSLTGQEEEKAAAKARQICVKLTCDFANVTPMLIMVIQLMAMEANQMGDIESAKLHFAAVGRLFHTGLKPNPLQWLWIQAMNLGMASVFFHAPTFPLPLPKEFDIPLGLSAQSTINIDTLTKANTKLLSNLIADDFKRLSKLFQDLHTINEIWNTTSLQEEKQKRSVCAKAFSLAGRTCEYMAKTNAKVRTERDKTMLQCEKLLAAALQSCAWRHVKISISGPGFYDRPGIFSPKTTNSRFCIPYSLEAMRASAHLTIRELGGLQNVVNIWSRYADLKGLIWVFATLSVDDRVRRQRTHIYWINLLKIVTREAGIFSAYELRDLLKTWPSGSVDIESIVQAFSEDYRINERIIKDMKPDMDLQAKTFLHISRL